MASIPQIQFLSNAYLDDGATPEIWKKLQEL